MSLYVCVYMYMYVCVWVYICILCSCVCICMCVCMPAYVCTSLHAFVNNCEYAESNQALRNDI